MFYAVAKGRKRGIYKTWTECEKHVRGFKNAKFKKFPSEQQAREFIVSFDLTPTPGPDRHPLLRATNSPDEDIYLAQACRSRLVDELKEQSSKAVTKSPNEGIAPDIDYYVYTDGACSHNGQTNAKAGMGIYFGANDPRNTSEKVHGRQTNNVAELTAIIECFPIIKQDLRDQKRICIMSDSKYSIGCATTYGKKMANSSWAKSIPNKELVRKIYEIYSNEPNVTFKHVKAHTSKDDIHSIGNHNADRLANEAIGLSSCPYV